MSTETRTNVEALIDELHRSAATQLAWRAHWWGEADNSQARYPWRQHDARIYNERAKLAEERAEADLLAARHLMGEL